MVPLGTGADSEPRVLQKAPKLFPFQTSHLQPGVIIFQPIPRPVTSNERQKKIQHIKRTCNLTPKGRSSFFGPFLKFG
jgi:hypothetical protein